MNAKKVKAARRLFREILKRNNVSPDAITFKNYCKSLKTNGMYEEFLDKALLGSTSRRIE